MWSIDTNKFTERSIYGLIITATLLITLERYEDNSWDMIATVLLTLMAVVIAEHYARLFAHGASKDSRISQSDIAAMFTDYLYMIYGSAIPTLLFLISGFGAISLLSAFNAAEFVAALLLIAYGYVYGRKRGYVKLVSLLYGLMNFSVVGLIVLLKSLTHV